MPNRFRGVDRSIEDAARQNRKQPTAAEAMLWQELRGRRLAGLKFRRQQPLSQFVVDFVCTEHRLIVEVDGDSHQFQREYDEARTEVLLAFGYRVLRFGNEQVLNDLHAVLLAIKTAATST